MFCARKSQAFTLLEFLATIAIVALLAVLALEFVPAYLSWAKQVSDQRTLTILNDALTRYKTEGGSLSALTVGAPIGDVLGQMKSPLSWGGISHNVMETAATYPARSLNASGNGSDYHFYKYNTYTETTPAKGVPTTTYPYGQGVGYMSNNNDPGGYNINCWTSTGCVACKSNTGTITYINSNDPTATLPPAQSYTFWACPASGNPAFSGNITYVMASNGDYMTISTINLTALDVTGLTSLIGVFCENNANLTTLNLSGLSTLTNIYCYGDGITSLNINGCPGLKYLYCNNTPLTSLNVSGLQKLTQLACQNTSITTLSVSNCPILNYIDCDTDPLTSFSVSGLPALNDLEVYSCPTLASLSVSSCATLQTIDCYSDALTSLSISSCPQLNYIDCDTNSLTSLSLRGFTALNTLYCNSNNIHSLDITGDTSLPLPPCTDGSYSSNFCTDGESFTGP